jgi:hypothetical protein
MLNAQRIHVPSARNLRVNLGLYGHEPRSFFLRGFHFHQLQIVQVLQRFARFLVRRVDGLLGLVNLILRRLNCLARGTQYNSRYNSRNDNIGSKVGSRNNTDATQEARREALSLAQLSGDRSTKTQRIWTTNLLVPNRKTNH